MTFRIVSDSACDLNEEYVRKNNIDIVPFYITLDGVNFFRDRYDIKSDELMDMMNNDKDLFPKTSQPNPEDYRKVFEKIAKENKDIICFTLSSTVSGSYQSAIIAKKEIESEYNIKIKIVDTKLATLAQAILIKKAVDLKKEGKTLEDIYSRVEKVKTTAKMFILFDTLKYLEKGGRISSSQKIIGNALKIKIILELRDGKLEILSKSIGRKKGIKKIIEIIEKELGNRDNKKQKIFISHSNSFEDANSIKEQLSYIDFPFEIEYISPVLMSHAGPGAIAIGILETE